MDEKDIEIFETLMKTKNVTRTAEQLFTTQSAVTKRIQRLEENLKCTLFIRTKRGVIPTAQAEHIQPVLQDIAQSMQKIRSYTAGSQGEIAGSIQLGSSVNYARYRLAPLLKEFMETYSKVDISVTTEQSTQLFRMFSENQFSAVIVRGDFDWKDGCVELSSESVCLVRNHQQLNTPLSELPYIRRKSDADFEAKLHCWMEEQNIHAGCASLEINDISACLSMVSAGIGWTVLPEICLAGFDGSIEPLFFQDGSAFRRSTYLLYRQSCFALPQVKCFVQKLLSYEYSSRTGSICPINAKDLAAHKDH